jgi:poly-beta-hydroxyalkanoate depolymerase
MMSALVHRTKLTTGMPMLYQLHEMQRSLLTPLMQWADASSKLFTNPVSPFAHTPFSQRIAAGYELMYRLGKDYENRHLTSTAPRSRVRRSASSNTWP